MCSGQGCRLTSSSRKARKGRASTPGTKGRRTSIVSRVRPSYLVSYSFQSMRLIRSHVDLSTYPLLFHKHASSSSVSSQSSLLTSTKNSCAEVSSSLTNHALLASRKAALPVPSVRGVFIARLAVTVKHPQSVLRRMAARPTLKLVFSPSRVAMLQ